LQTETYDIAVTGGGLAGLSVSIQLARKGYKIILFEKETYPFHRVCGEYISNESWNYLESLGINLENAGVSHINRLIISTRKGKTLEQELPLGGFGISRYKLDHELASLAKNAGVYLLEGIRVNEIKFESNEFHIQTSNGIYHSKVAVAGSGKRSNLDVKWKRSFIMAKKNKLNNYIGVKYHVKLPFSNDTIALHNFNNGYCGISKVEGDEYCLCYLTTAANLQSVDGQLKEMEKRILMDNPHLKKIWNESEMLFEEPVIISQISFDKKSQLEDHVLMVGDAAGMITPLCGNGMSMALHAGKIASEEIDSFLKGVTAREEMEMNYQSRWKKQFAKRLQMGRRIQRLFTNNWLISLVISIGKIFPSITRQIIRQTHGEPF